MKVLRPETMLFLQAFHNLRHHSYLNQMFLAWILSRMESRKGRTLKERQLTTVSQLQNLDDLGDPADQDKVLQIFKNQNQQQNQGHIDATKQGNKTPRGGRRGTFKGPENGSLSPKSLSPKHAESVKPTEQDPALIQQLKEHEAKVCVITSYLHLPPLIIVCLRKSRNCASASDYAETAFDSTPLSFDSLSSDLI